MPCMHTPVLAMAHSAVCVCVCVCVNCLVPFFGMRCPGYALAHCLQVPSLTHALGRTCLTGLFRELATGRVLLQKLDSFPKVASHCVPNHPKLLRLNCRTSVASCCVLLQISNFDCLGAGIVIFTLAWVEVPHRLCCSAEHSQLTESFKFICVCCMHGMIWMIQAPVRSP